MNQREFALSPILRAIMSLMGFAILFLYSNDAVSQCMAVAPTMTIDGTTCPDGSIGAPFVVTDGGDGSANAGEITEYYVIDDAAGTASGVPSGIITAGALGTAQAVVDGLAVGAETCVASITYVPADLDAHIADLDACGAANGLPPGSIYAALGLPPTGNTIGGLVAGLIAASGMTTDKATIEGILAGGTIDLGVLAGFPPGVLVCTDVTAVCYACSAPVCVVVAEACSGGATCMAAAPTMSITGTACPNGSTGAPYTVTDAADGSTNAGEITEYYVIDDAAGTASGVPSGIIAAGAIGTAQAAVDGLADGEEVCVASVTYVPADLDAHIADLDACGAANGLPAGTIYTALGLPTTGNTIGGLVAGLIAASGMTTDKVTVEGILAGGTIDLGVLAGFPPGTLVCTDVTEVCFACSPIVCVTAASCAQLDCDATNGTLTVKKVD